ncbi:hypothetical protein BHM03_00054940 [Ensete ventricosum]|nr:hypothetical protein BHM03_00054940 [Ensete ventricosum]
MDEIMTWQFQVGSLADQYDVCGSATDPPECSPDFHADGLPRRATVHRHGVQLRRRGVVQTSGEVARPGQLPGRVGLHVRHDRFSQQYNSQAARRLILAEFLLPVSVKGVKALFSAATYRKLWFPNCFHRDFLERILLLWGENDKILNLELAKNIKEYATPTLSPQVCHWSGFGLS